jgi:hypothetical protein
VEQEVFLPRASDARIPEDKLKGYALNPDHPTGQHKARMFDRPWASSRMIGNTSVTKSWNVCLTARRPHGSRRIAATVLRLRVPSGEWEAGTEGTVVEVLEDTALVEIADEEGRTRDLLSVPLDAVTPVTPQAQERLPV